MTKKLVSTLLFWACAQSASATFIGDTLNADYNNAFGNVFDSTATVGTGVEFSGSNVIHDYTLDFTGNAFTLTVSKDFSAGNFTGIFTNLAITDIDYLVNSVTFDAAASSSFNGSASEPAINIATPGSIILSHPGTFLSANTPASARSHSFTWNVDFGGLVTVAEPSLFLLFGLGIFSTLAMRRAQSRQT